MSKVYVPNFDEYSASKGPGGYVPGQYQMRIEGVETKSAKSGRMMDVVEFTIIDGPEDTKGNEVAGRPFTYRNLHLKEGDSQGYTKRRMGELKNFLEQFGLPMEADGYDPEDWIGAEGPVVLKQQDSNPQYCEVDYFGEA
jgi:hypothetical protein